MTCSWIYSASSSLVVELDRRDGEWEEWKEERVKGKEGAKREGGQNDQRGKKIDERWKRRGGEGVEG